MPETLSLEKKALIVGMSLGHVSVKEIAEKFGVSIFVVYKLINTYKKRGTLKPKPSTGRPKILSIRDVRSLKRTVKKDRRTPLQDITNKLSKE
ncbi:hypothetical protein BGX20_004868, partial [Mortierella sp. AD010]